MTANREHKPGTRVVIAHNPFHAAATGIVGVVTRTEPGSGFMGCDLIYVRYQHPTTGETHELPFSDANVTPGESEQLLARARWHEEQAALMRRMAGEAGRLARDDEEAGRTGP
ncbi:MAG TPA: hypothetical protein VJP77_06175 [Planctomycetota bacterium]|nr:hypothetical protein [Planctomycetota bacterium]